MESVINEIEFDFDQTVSIRTDVKLSKDDVKQIVSEAPEETLEEIVYQSLVTDELYLRARAKEIVAKLKQEDLDVNRIEYWDDEGNKVRVCKRLKPKKLSAEPQNKSEESSLTGTGRNTQPRRPLFPPGFFLLLTHLGETSRQSRLSDIQRHSHCPFAAGRTGRQCPRCD